MLEQEVKNYLSDYSSEDESFSEDLELDVTVGGVVYSATVSVNASFSFEPIYESDKYGISYHVGDTCSLEDFDFQIKDLWDSEVEDYITID